MHPRLSAKLRSLGRREDEGEQYSWRPPFGTVEVVGVRAEANPATGEVKCIGGIPPFERYDKQLEAGFNCFVRPQRRWSGFLLFTDIVFDHALVEYKIRDEPFGSTLRMTVAAFSKVAAWRRESGWIGIGEAAHDFYRREYDWDMTEGGDRDERMEQLNLSMSVSHTFNQSVPADKELMLRAGAYYDASWRAVNYSITGMITRIEGVVREITVIGFE